MSKPPSLNEIRARLDGFVHEHANDHQERAEAQTWWNDLLDCYGIRRARVATFERRATRASTGGRGRIDVFWPRVFIGEHKSAGRIDTADDQAIDYLNGGDVTPAEFPRYIIVSDFRHIRINDLESDDPPVTIPVTDLPAHAELFGFLAGYTRRTYTTAQEAAASVEASKLMANLYAKLSGDADTNEPDDEDTHQVSMLLTRLLFIMFGDDAGLWDRNLFGDFVQNRTSTDGSDLGAQLMALFAILNTPEHRRPARADEALLAFPYVNGALFEGQSQMPFFDAGMREALLEACRFDWTAISPAVFGSLFQAIKSRRARREGGEHYTTEENILKTIGPLFLDDLHARLKAAWNQPRKLRALHDEIGAMRYLDPACGCGNFLVVAYREMRRLELELLVRLKELDGSADEMTLDGTWDLKVSLDQFRGIEIGWWPAKIAETAMFLVDHQANREMALALGQAPDRLPIEITAHIHHTNALTADWAQLLPPTGSTFLFGNPPFLGHASRSEDQAAELRTVWGRNDISRLDYVTAWYAKTLDYFSEVNGEWAFVSTNSITQGDPVPHLFGPVFDAGWRIKFAHRTFAWASEAPGRAAVHCAIIGFTRNTPSRPRLFDYPSLRSDPQEIAAGNINGYLVDGPNVFVSKRMTPLSVGLPQATFGAMPRDDGNLIVEPADYAQVMADPVAAAYVRPFRGARQLLHNEPRWCLWLTNLDPADVPKSPVLKERLDACRAFRLNSTASSTRGMAATPHLFGQRPAEMTTAYLCIPRHVSETRHYFTAARFERDVICGDSNFLAPDPDGFLFAIISSSMFITWQRTVGGRIKSDLRFSNTIVWNNLPLPAIGDKSRAKIINAGQGVLDARALHPDRSLAEHYNPLAMDPALVKAHAKLNAVVDRAFGAPGTCRSERERQEILFARYQELTASATTIGAPGSPHLST